MPRRGGFGGGSKSSSSSRNYSTSSKPTPSNKPSTQTTPTPTSTPQSGGGFFSNIASTAIGVGTGMFLGRSISNMFGGESNNEDKALMDNNQQQQQNPCQIYFETFGNCLNANKDKISNCQWAYDQLLSCNEQRQF
eukprot:TRINITY_DN997_c0_g1_i1.p1 TRINITY_DN997_c0_g1~~TRINITY_DN997_c0_g1_i1.p1  ORF type:complete len:136 (+),score=47.81 TRINITY_DN997_c0_g1_i1:45-452(+)